MEERGEMLVDPNKRQTTLYSCSARLPYKHLQIESSAGAGVPRSPQFGLSPPVLPASGALRRFRRLSRSPYEGRRRKETL